MVSAWASEAGLVLGQLRVDEKSNEIPAVPELLELIDAQGCIITSDAMSCQKKTVQKIAEKQCDYVISLKGNQETLHEDVKLYFETALQEFKLYPLGHTVTLDKRHGRIEKREYYLTQDVEWMKNRSEWTNLNAIGMFAVRELLMERKVRRFGILYHP